MNTAIRLNEKVLFELFASLLKVVWLLLHFGLFILLV